MQAVRSRASDYDTVAEGYTAENETSLMNAYLERPAALALAGEVAGRRILDAGCGSGPLFAELRERGAVVSGFDGSPGMLEQARRRLGADADLRVADLAGPLPYADDAFDDVMASFVLHYLRDWGPTLTELRRVLRPGGRIIASVEHPLVLNLMKRHTGPRPDYFATENRLEDWTMGGGTAQLSFWDRPLEAMTDAFLAAGLRITRLHEPRPVPAAHELFPDDFHIADTCPSVLFFVLHSE
ncbi:methyltransferase family protein [Actinoalloteichus sp. GBA129-24]|uniref:Methyltransferase family protein n=1 Tax=Actinoalloteichus fjordicus TaxID=1612552 RepID=A0AAC9LC86_9PSEU|nr:methyltransferase family protein [Actinoalloteichus fjordicus]APU21201.1 methyltransferase family protein [Actinoalloteichus sp. GBA129-24]